MAARCRTGRLSSRTFRLRSTPAPACARKESALSAESTRTRGARAEESAAAPGLEASAPEPPADALVWRSINAIRALAMDAVEAAQSGHPGTPMALAPAAYVLWHRFLRHNPTDPDWPDRDRFVLSCGHASMLQYALLYLAGYDVSLDDLRAFRQWGSKTPGHPERGHTPGVETTTGPLGQGVGNAVGMAIAERFLAEHFNRPGHRIIDHRTWAFVSDGDLMEGVASEAVSLAGHLRLGKLTLIYDDNHITIDGDTALSFSEDVPRRFEAYGWHVVRVGDGNDLAAIGAALEAARAETVRPTLVALRTYIADPAPTKRNSSKAHGEPLGAEEVRRTKEIMGWPEEPRFFVPDDALDHWRQIATRGAVLETEWRARLAAYAADEPEAAGELQRWLSGALPDGWDAGLPALGPESGPLATRQASGLALQALAAAVPNLVGGSADLGGSTGTTLKQGGVFGPTSSGRTFHWGIREHGMAACLNGIAAHGGVRPFGSTFLVFSDYMKPAIRLAAIMRLPVIYIGTHDSIGVGEDGPTHQPIEHLAMLRAIPNLVVLRPADATETVEAWRTALARTAGPTLLVLSRQKLPVLDRTALGLAAGAARGGYVLLDPPGGTPQAILIATGSEVHVALAAARLLQADRVRVRVVSLPSWELFAAEPQSYRDEVLPPGVRVRLAIEAASPFGWERWVTTDGAMLGMESFGASAPGDRLFEEFKFTPDRAAAMVRQLLAQRHVPSRSEGGA
ncbi:MAG TPA: transketolase [Gemmatimonadales bacterium]|nr:transketolase [Gemmatimonadales bacterium]